MVRGHFTIRFCVTYEFANEEHIGKFCLQIERQLRQEKANKC